jgi:DNA polymerase-3 subunit epsilon/CBS domain-containing protein
MLAAAGENVPSATDLLGRLRTQQGRIDLKKHGLFPVVAGARAVALAWGSAATSTDARLAEAASKGAFPEDSARALAEARAIVVEEILDQQLKDIAAGLTPDNRVATKPLGRRATARLREALASAAGAPELVREALANRPIVAPP